jgi:hypothetical protein
VCNTPVKSPIIICPPNQTISDEYLFTVGDPITDMQYIDYGFYDHVGANRFANPTAQQISDDIDTVKPDNYIQTTWTNNMVIPITYPGDDGVNVCYHVFRVPGTLSPITITDEGGVVVNAGWTVLTYSTYTIYILKISTAPSTVKYKLSL